MTLKFKDLSNRNTRIILFQSTYSCTFVEESFFVSYTDGVVKVETYTEFLAYDRS